MSVNLNEAMLRIRKAGPAQVRATPMPGQDVRTGMYQVEVLEDRTWVVLVEGLPRSSADDIIKQATNRVICG